LNSRDRPLGQQSSNIILNNYINQSYQPKLKLLGEVLRIILY
jgi:hypothetical protein